LRVFLEAVDPNLAPKLIMPADEATTKEVIESPLGRGNQFWIVAGDAGTMRWVALRERWIAASG
jgi:hypothetical protein